VSGGLWSATRVPLSTKRQAHSGLVGTVGGVTSRRRILGVAVVVLVAALGVAAVTLGGDEESDYVWTETKWTLDAISRDQRKLTLAFPSGGCTNDKGRAHLQESRSFVQIRVEASNPRAETACTADRRTGHAVVRLRERLEGRRIRGASKDWATSDGRLGGPYVIRGEYVIFRVPRVAGLSVSDARRLLDAHRFVVSGRPRTDEKQAIARGTRPRLGRPAYRVRILSR
jgi:hypothetical protein